MADEYKDYEVPFKITGKIIVRAKSKGDAIEEVFNSYSSKDMVELGIGKDIVIAPGYREVKAVD